jgi:hypothetical protein
MTAQSALLTYSNIFVSQVLSTYSIVSLLELLIIQIQS